MDKETEEKLKNIITDKGIRIDNFGTVLNNIVEQTELLKKIEQKMYFIDTKMDKLVGRDWKKEK